MILAILSYAAEYLTFRTLLLYLAVNNSLTIIKAKLYILLLPLALIVLFTQCSKDNQVEFVDIPDKSFLDALIELGVDTDGDGNISVTEAESVRSLDVYQCGISDMSGIEKFRFLRTLKCSYNQIASLDISNNKYLDTLWCASNHLTSLDVSHNTTLGVLQCSENQLTGLDISINIQLGQHSGGFVELDLSQMPALYKVCVWEMPFPPGGLEVDTTGSPNVYFTTECSQ